MNSTVVSTLLMILMLAVFYAVILIPENKRKKRYASMLGRLKVNDEVLTKGGIIGRIVNIQDKFIILQTGPDRIRVKIDKNGILNTINEKEEVKEVKSEEKKES
jgi:preprotein translocase subunit YajC